METSDNVFTETVIDDEQVGFTNAEFIEIQRKVALSPDENIVDVIDKNILKKLRKKYEGRCVDLGYVVRSSINILSRSSGHFPSESLAADRAYHVNYVMTVCNPPLESVVDARITTKNMVGATATLIHPREKYDNPLLILIPAVMVKQHVLETYSELDIGSVIKIKVLQKRHRTEDEQITVIAELFDINKQSDTPLPGVEERKNDDEEEEYIEGDVDEGDIDIEDDEGEYVEGEYVEDDIEDDEGDVFESVDEE